MDVQDSDEGMAFIVLRECSGHASATGLDTFGCTRSLAGDLDRGLSDIMPVVDIERSKRVIIAETTSLSMLLKGGELQSRYEVTSFW